MKYNIEQEEISEEEQEKIIGEFMEDFDEFIGEKEVQELLLMTACNGKKLLLAKAYGGF